MAAMEARLTTPLSSLTEGSELAQLREEIGRLREQIADLKRQLDWFKRQLFGQKSERRGVEPPPE